MRRFALSLAALLALTVLGGCIVFKGPIAVSQQDVIGKVRVSFTACGSESDDAADPDTHPGCPEGGNGGFLENNSTFQPLVAMRVPAGTTAPDSFVANVSTGATLRFTRSASYERELNEALPEAGARWIGWLSQSYLYAPGADGTNAQEMTVSVDLTLLPPAGGAPFRGPFRVKPVMGGRVVSEAEGLPANRPVNCPEPILGGTLGSTICVDTATPANIGTNEEAATRDLGIAGSAATADPGQTAQVPFTARFAGAAPGAAFTLSARTALPGGSATPSVGSFTPGADSTTPLAARVSVPANAGPGRHDVTLTARLANGQTRTATTTLTVRDKQRPVARSLRLRPTRFAPFIDTSSIAAAKGTRVSFQLSEAADVRFTVQRRRGRRFRRVRGSFRHAGEAGANSFRFTGFLRGRKLRPGRYRLTGVATDAAGNRSTAVRARFRLVRR